jgi:hypothetical protein
MLSDIFPFQMPPDIVAKRSVTEGRNEQPNEQVFAHRAKIHISEGMWNINGIEMQFEVS